MKNCTKCGVTKEESDFHRHAKRYDGLAIYCKACKYSADRTHYTLNSVTRAARCAAYKARDPGKWAAYAKAWRQTKQGKEAARAAASIRKLIHPHALKAARRVNHAIRDGHLVRKPCEVCGAPKTDGHHDSYAIEDWLTVRWLCRKHHRQVHLKYFPSPAQPPYANP